MSLFKSQPKYFITSGKDKLQIIIDEITDFDEEPYAIAAGSYTAGDGEIEALHERRLKKLRCAG